MSRIERQGSHVFITALVINQRGPVGAELHRLDTGEKNIVRCNLLHLEDSAIKDNDCTGKNRRTRF